MAGKLTRQPASDEPRVASRVLAWLFVIFAGCVLPPMVSAADVTGFLKSHCYDCHSENDPDGGLDLSSLDGRLDSAEQVGRWTLILDRIQHGEMPPEDAEQPESREVDSLLNELRPRLIEADRTTREVVQRRINRQEYEHTVHDLLHIDVPLKQMLPEDQTAGGFSNNGDALAVSTEQLQAYLAAAEFAIDAAIVTSPRPELQAVTAESVREVTPYFGKSYQQVDDRIVVFMASRKTYSKISSRDKRKAIKVRGRYRISFEAAAHNSTTPKTILVNADRTLRYFEVPAEPTTFTFESVLEPNGVVQFHGADLPGWVKDPVQTKAAGVGFGPVTITGPLHDSWPPESHRRLFGNLDIADGDLSDAKAILAGFLPRAFRRPVTEAEIKRYAQLVAGRLDVGRSFEDAMRVGLAAALCSPNFLYMNEAQRSAGGLISDSELATRLSYFLWNSTPDDRLMQLTSAGQLSTPETLRAEVDRMLLHSRSDRFVRDFTDHWLTLKRIDETTPDKKLFKEFDDHLKFSMLTESRGFFRHLLQQDLDISLFLDSDFAMLNRRLARHYEIPNVSGAEVHPIKLPEDSIRGGVLTQAAILKVTANGTNTSPVTRGVWVLENILGRHLPPPPPNVSAIDPDIRGAETVRQQLEMHRSDPSCRVCHQHIDPPGFALESFDPVTIANATSAFKSIQSMQTKCGDDWWKARMLTRLEILLLAKPFAMCGNSNS